MNIGGRKGKKVEKKKGEGRICDTGKRKKNGGVGGTTREATRVREIKRGKM